MKEHATDKRFFSITVPIETIKRVERKFAKDGDKSFRDSIVRALAEATKNVKLTAQEYVEIAREIDANIIERMAKRQENKKGAH